MKVSPTDPRLQAIAYTATTLSPGQVSSPVPIQSDDTNVIIHLDSRDKPDPAGLADFEKHFRQSQDQQLRSAVYIDWANWASKQPGTRKPPQLEAYGSVE
jgi:parvulin-like peptidyl-prolyl isomerase